MKRLCTFIGLFIFGLLLHNGLADISLRLRGAGSGPSYLPPPIQDVPVNEQQFNVQDASSEQHHSFQESNFGDAHYQIFEVHNHLAPSSKQQAQQPHPATQSNYEAQGYLPPLTQEIHIQHVNQAHDANDDNLDVSFLSFSAGEDTSDGHQVTISENVSKAKAATASPVPFSSSYQHERQRTDIRSGKQLEGAVFRGSDYLPPNRKPSAATQEIRIEHVYPSHASGNQQLSDPRKSNFRASEYLPPPGAKSEAEFRAPDYLPPQRDAHHHSNNEVQNEQRFKGPDYLPPHKGSKDQNHGQHFDAQAAQVSTSVGGNQVYPAQGYLPPQTGNGGSHIQFAGPDYLPPHRESYKGSDYLPPHAEVPQSHQASHNNFKAPEYLPPHAEVPQPHQASHNNFKAPDYLPPHAEVPQPHQASHNNFKAPDYLPPHAEVPQSHQASQNNFRAPDYLPPHAEVPQSQNNFKAPDYLPPHQENSIAADQNNYKGPDYLPPHHEYTVSVGKKEYKASDAENRAPGQLPPGYDFSNPEKEQVPLQATPTQEKSIHQEQGLLPSGYDFTKPPNSEQAIALLHSQSTSSPAKEQHQQQGHQEVVVGTQIPVDEREQVPNIIYGSNQQSGSHVGAHFDAIGYAEGKSTSILQGEKQTSYQVGQGDHQAISNYNTFEQTIPSSEPVQQQYKAPDYLPPVIETPAQHHQKQYSQVHSLSSYMTTVQPFGHRYGDTQFTEPRKPFAQYGPPPAQHAVVSQPIVQQQTTAVSVAPMYREQATRSQYYAPGMSYNANAYTSNQQQSFRRPTPSSFNKQTKQTLQSLMPKDIQIQSQVATAQAPSTAGATVPATTLPTSGKIRTVQIINLNAVKTLKVLETSDRDGVKTIKILGASNENPIGEHHIVKVVSQSVRNGINENHVQTVKIYNDQQEVAIPIDTASATYLPPTAVAHATAKRSVLVPRHPSPSTPENKNGSNSKH